MTSNNYLSSVNLPSAVTLLTVFKTFLKNKYWSYDIFNVLLSINLIMVINFELGFFHISTKKNRN